MAGELPEGVTDERCNVNRVLQTVTIPYRRLTQEVVRRLRESSKQRLELRPPGRTRRHSARGACFLCCRGLCLPGHRRFRVVAELRFQMRAEQIYQTSVCS